MKLLNPFKTFAFLPKLQFFILKTAANLKGAHRTRGAWQKPAEPGVLQGKKQ